MIVGLLWDTHGVHTWIKLAARHFVARVLGIKRSSREVIGTKPRAHSYPC